MSLRFIIFFFIVFTADGLAQGLMEDKLLPTRQDSLRGSITPEREWWDLTYYHLDVKVEPEKKFISGSNTIHYRVLENQDRMQIDLQAPLNITKVIQDNKELKFEKEGNAHFIKLKSKQKKGKIKSIEVFYEGNPKVEAGAWFASWKQKMIHNTDEDSLHQHHFE